MFCHGICLLCCKYTRQNLFPIPINTGGATLTRGNQHSFPSGKGLVVCTLFTIFF